MRGTIAKMLRRAVRKLPAPFKPEYGNAERYPHAYPLTFRYPADSAQAEYKALKRLYRSTAR